MSQDKKATVTGKNKRVGLNEFKVLLLKEAWISKLCEYLTINAGLRITDQYLEKLNLSFQVAITMSFWDNNQTTLSTNIPQF